MICMKLHKTIKSIGFKKKKHHKKVGKISLTGHSNQVCCPISEKTRLHCFPLERSVKNEEFVEDHFGDLP